MPAICSSAARRGAASGASASCYVSSARASAKQARPLSPALSARRDGGRGVCCAMKGVCPAAPRRHRRVFSAPASRMGAEARRTRRGGRPRSSSGGRAAGARGSAGGQLETGRDVGGPDGEKEVGGRPTRILVVRPGVMSAARTVRAVPSTVERHTRSGGGDARAAARAAVDESLAEAARRVGDDAGGEGGGEGGDGEFDLVLLDAPCSSERHLLADADEARSQTAAPPLALTSRPLSRAHLSRSPLALSLALSLAHTFRLFSRPPLALTSRPLSRPLSRGAHVSCTPARARPRVMVRRRRARVPFVWFARRARARRGQLARWSRRRVTENARRQAALLRAALAAVRVGGRVCYATCALSPAENDGVVTEVRRSGLSRRRAKKGAPSSTRGRLRGSCSND